VHFRFGSNVTLGGEEQTNPNRSLTLEEFESLLGFAKKARTKKIPPEHLEKLLTLGFIAKEGGDYVLTEAGQKRLAGR